MLSQVPHCAMMNSTELLVSARIYLHTGMSQVLSLNYRPQALGSVFCTRFEMLIPRLFPYLFEWVNVGMNKQPFNRSQQFVKRFHPRPGERFFTCQKHAFLSQIIIQVI